MRLDKKTGKTVQNDVHEVDIKIFFTPATSSSRAVAGGGSASDADEEINRQAESMAHRIAMLLRSHFDGNPLNVADEHLSWVAAKAIVDELRTDFRRVQQRMDGGESAIYEDNDDELCTREPIVSRLLQQPPPALAPAQQAAAPAQQANVAVALPGAGAAAPAPAANGNSWWASVTARWHRGSDSDADEKFTNISLEISPKGTYRNSHSSACTLLAEHHENGAFPTVATVEVQQNGGVWTQTNGAAGIVEIAQNIRRQLEVFDPSLYWRFFKVYPNVLKVVYKLARWNGLCVPALPFATRIISEISKLSGFNKLPFTPEAVTLLPSKVQNFISRHYILYTGVYYGALLVSAIFSYGFVYGIGFFHGYRLFSREVYKINKHVADQLQLALMQTRGGADRFSPLSGGGTAAFVDADDYETPAEKEEDTTMMGVRAASSAVLQRQNSTMVASNNSSVIASVTVVTPNQDYTCVLKRKQPQRIDENTSPGGKESPQLQQSRPSGDDVIDESETVPTKSKTPATNTAKRADIFAAASATLGVYTELAKGTLWLPREVMATMMAFLCKASVHVVEVPSASTSLLSSNYFRYNDDIGFSTDMRTAGSESTTTSLTPTDSSSHHERGIGMLSSKLKALVNLRWALELAFYGGITISLLRTFVTPRLSKVGATTVPGGKDVTSSPIGKKFLDLTRRLLLSIEKTTARYSFSYHILLSMVSLWKLQSVCRRNVFRLGEDMLASVFSQGGAKRNPFGLLKIYCNDTLVYCMRDEEEYSRSRRLNVVGGGADDGVVGDPCEMTLIRFASQIAQRIRRETRRDDDTDE